MSTRGCTGRALCFLFLWIPSHGGSGLEWEAPSVTEILVEIECSDWVFLIFFFPEIGNVLVPSALPLALVTQRKYRKSIWFITFTKKDDMLLLVGRILRGSITLE